VGDGLARGEVNSHGPRLAPPEVGQGIVVSLDPALDVAQRLTVTHQ
jgi:hypothetical protein